MLVVLVTGLLAGFFSGYSFSERKTERNYRNAGELLIKAVESDNNADVGKIGAVASVVREVVKATKEGTTAHNMIDVTPLELPPVTGIED